MAKKNEKGFLKEITSFTGQVSGSIKGALETAADFSHLRQPEPEPAHEDVQFEKSDISSRGVIIGGACFLAGMWITIGLLFFYFAYLKNHRQEVSPPTLPAALRGRTLPPEPRLQASPEQDLRTFRAREDWELNHYYWLDKNKGQVAIPIEQAIQMLAKRGIPAQNAPPNPTLTTPREGTRATGFEGKVEPEPR